MNHGRNTEPKIKSFHTAFDPNIEQKMAELLERIIQNSHGVTGRIKTASALNPLLWFSAVTFPACMTVFGLNEGPKAWVAFAFAFMIFISVCTGFFYLLFKKPDYLRSEDFHIKKFATEMIGEKSAEFPSGDVAKFLTTNPYSGDRVE